MPNERRDKEEAISGNDEEGSQRRWDWGGHWNMIVYEQA